MSKISTYEVAPVPKLADKLIGTSVGGEIEDVTYNFTLQELLDVFLPVIPANNLQGVLDYGNTATQDINLFGTITTTNLEVVDTANLFITYLNEETHIAGGLFDSEDSIGLAGQVLTSTGEFVEWVTLPPIFTPNLQQVLDIGNTSDTGIILDAGFEALDVNTDTATINTNITIDGTITDGNASVGVAGTVLSSTGTGVEWVALPVYSATSPLLFNSATGVFSIQQANGSQSGFLSSSDWVTFNGKQNAGNYITALTGEVTASGPGSAIATVSNAAVIGKVLTGFNPTAGTINASDSILTAFGKTQSQINALVGGVQYQGVWNASTNTPTLTSSVGVQGHYYVVNVAGNTNLNGITDWQIGDWAIFSESVWQKVDNTESVSSVNGFTGAVSLTTDNIPEGSTNLYFLNSRARLALSATSPLGYDNSTGVFSIQQASGSQNGYLSSTDWTTFNDKQNYLGGTGLVKSSAGTITYITDNSANWNTAYNDSITSAAVTGTGTKTLTLTQQDAGTITASWTDLGLTSVGISMPSAFNVANSPLTSNGTIAITGAGVASQYIRGDGTLATLPTGGGGGGASVSYYLNGSINQGTIGGNTYYEMSKVPIIGTGTDFTINADGYISQFITDVGDPALLNIPAGNWNFEMFFSASSSGGTPSFYVELYKYDGVVLTLISSSSATPEVITGGTSIDLYNTALAVPATSLTLTDRLAIRVYVNHSGRTITLHTEDNHLCQVITTFSTGITALNGLTAQVQNLTTGTSGTDFNINSLGNTHTFNLPVASATNTGKLSSTDWSTFNGKVPYTGATSNVDLGTNSIGANTFLALGNGTSGGFISFTQTGTLAGISTGVASIGSVTAGQLSFYYGNNLFASIFSNTSLSASRTFTLPDISGTLALTSNLSSYLPLSGGIMTGNILLNNNIAISGQIFGTSGYAAMLAMSPSNKVLIDNNGQGVIFGGTIGQGAYTYNLPSASGTLALTSDLGGYVTLATTQTITGAKTFSLDILVNSLTIGKGSGSISGNTAIGVSSLNANTTGNWNTAIGFGTLPVNLTGNGNTAIGYTALGNNTNTANTAIGYAALVSNTTGFSNVAVGYNSMVNSNGNENTAIGNQSMQLNTNGVSNTAIGHTALQSNTTGNNNIGIGYESGKSITTGNYNTIIGSYVGTAAMSNNIVLADGQGNIRYQWNGTNNVFTNPISATTALFNGSVDVLNGNINISNSYYLTARNNANNTFLRLIGRNPSDKVVIDPDGYGVIFGGTIGQGAYTYNLPSASGTLALTSDLGGYVTLGTAQDISGNKAFTALSTKVEAIGIKLTSGVVSTENYLTLNSKVVGTVHSLILAPDSTTNRAEFTFDNTALRTYALPNASGTLALTSALSGYLPLTGGTLTGPLTATAFIPSGSSIPTNGMYLPSANTLGFVTNSTVDMIISSVGNVGIGASPVAFANYTYLQVTGKSTTQGGNLYLTTSDSSLTSEFYLDSTNGLSISSGNSSIRFVNNSFNRLVITSGGNVGIGTSSPGRKLSIEDSDIWMSYKVTGAREYLTGMGTSDAYRIFDNTAGVERMRITSGGNVGIGTSTFPAFTSAKQVTIKGDSTNTNSILQVQSFDAGTSLTIYSGAASSDDPAVIFQKNLRFGSATDTSLGGYSERMRITSGGNILMGTQSDNGNRLQISGSTTITGNLTIGSPSSALAQFHIYNASAAASMLVQTNSAADYAEIAARNFNQTSTCYYRQYSSSAAGTVFGASASNLAALFSNFASNFVIGTLNGGNLILGTGNTERMRISTTGAVSIVGSLSKGSGSFRIDHPLESMTETHQLVHSFVEAPQADLYYRGKLTLVNGKAQANIDEIATMTEGTFEVLCREVQCFTTNETGWDLVKGKVIGNIIYIESQNVNSTDEISWLVIGERKDKHMMETEWTDDNGRVIVEPLKQLN